MATHIKLLAASIVEALTEIARIASIDDKMTRNLHSDACRIAHRRTQATRLDTLTTTLLSCRRSEVNVRSDIEPQMWDATIREEQWHLADVTAQRVSRSGGLHIALMVEVAYLALDSELLIPAKSHNKSYTIAHLGVDIDAFG